MRPLLVPLLLLPLVHGCDEVCVFACLESNATDADLVACGNACDACGSVEILGSCLQDYKCGSGDHSAVTVADCDTGGSTADPCYAASTLWTLGGTGAAFSMTNAHSGRQLGVIEHTNSVTGGGDPTGELNYTQPTMVVGTTSLGWSFVAAAGAGLVPQTLPAVPGEATIGRILESSSGLCLEINTTATGFNERTSATLDERLYAGSDGGTRIDLVSCTAPAVLAAPGGDARALWTITASEEPGVFAITSAHGPSAVSFNGERPVCGGNFDQGYKAAQICTGPAVKNGSGWPSWLLALRVSRDLDVAAASACGPGDPDVKDQALEPSCRAVTPDPYEALPWVASNFVATQLMSMDRGLYDVATGLYTVDALLDDYIKRYGGVDTVLFWPTYPNIGIDDRNQWDYFYALPGGVQGVRGMVDDFHKRGVKVIIPINPWDTGTNQWSNGSFGAGGLGIGTNDGPLLSQATVLASLILEFGFDGFNGDTLTDIPYRFYDAAARPERYLDQGAAYPNRTGRAIMIEPENGFNGAAGVSWSVASWNYAFGTASANTGSGSENANLPTVSRYRMYEPRHMPRICDRWNAEHTSNIMQAWWNGIGFESWENIWGLWNQLDAHAAATLKRVSALLRFFHPLVHSRRWLPFAGAWVSPSDTSPASPTAYDYGVRASRWCVRGEEGGKLEDELASGSKVEQCLWALINTNRTESPPIGTVSVLIPKSSWIAQVCRGDGVPATTTGDPFSTTNCTFFDAYRGTPLLPMWSLEGSIEIRVPIKAYSIGAIWFASQSSSAIGEETTSFFASMAKLSAVPLDLISEKRPVSLQQTVTPIAHSEEVPIDADYNTTTGSVVFNGAEMVAVSGGNYTFTVSGTEIEGSDGFGIDVQYTWEGLPAKDHTHFFETVDELPAFWIDRFPVTCADYAAYLSTSGYVPGGSSEARDAEQWLKSWDHSTAPPTFPTGWEKKPVTHVSLQDARAYCRARKARLPREWEWQLAAQGRDGRRFPWGNELPTTVQGTHIPIPTKGNVAGAAADVDAHPAGASIFGAEDMVGNVWQWTDEYTDARTRSGILRGGSFYQPSSPTGDWYFPGFSQSDAEKWAPGAYDLETHGKLLLMAPSLDRAATLSFRCAADSSDAPPAEVPDPLSNIQFDIILISAILGSAVFILVILLPAALVASYGIKQLLAQSDLKRQAKGETAADGGVAQSLLGSDAGSVVPTSYGAAVADENGYDSVEAQPEERPKRASFQVERAPAS